MSASKELKQVSGLILDLLKMDKKYRESDRVLSAKIWAIQLGGYENLKTLSAYDFLANYVQQKSKLFSQDSIGRARRKIQEEHPELRGANYKSKQEEQAEVTQALGYGKKN